MGSQTGQPYISTSLVKGYQYKMLALQLFEDLLNKSQKLGQHILQQKDPVPLELFLQWRANCEKIGEYLSDTTFCTLAKKHDAYILVNPVNPASYAHFIRPDVQSKTLTIQARTLRTGICSGFLEADFQKKQLDFWIQGEQFYAVKRSSKECLVRKMISSDQELAVCCYENGYFIVSDVDLVAIFIRENADEVIFNPLYGELTSQELAMVQEMNQHFQELVSYCFTLPTSSSLRLIAHGAANRFSLSKAFHLHYPMKIYTPDGGVQLLEEDFLNFHEKMKLSGYFSPLNPNWRFA